MATAHVKNSAEFTIRRLSPNIGAQLDGIDLSQVLSETTIKAIYQALLDYKVIFFRDQDITPAQHLTFARHFGELEIHPFAAQYFNNDKESPEILRIVHDEKSKGKENIWHSDVTWRAEPSLGSILHGIEIPEVGGDTLFANMELAYESLSESLKSQIDQLTAIHDAPGFRAGMRANGVAEEKIAELEARFPEQEHPVVRTHPDTGRKSLYVNRAFTQRIVGMGEGDSERLLDFLYQQAAVPEYQCRFRWEKNSIAFWDNRSCQHYANSDYWPNKRVVERVTIIGEKPF